MQDVFEFIFVGAAIFNSGNRIDCFFVPFALAFSGFPMTLNFTISVIKSSLVGWLSGD